MANNKVWFITGASKGLGLILAQKLLAKGDAVAATSRNKQSLTDALGKHGNFLPLEVDLTKAASITKAIADTHKQFGRLDVVVNNAGYGIGGAVEEVSEKEVSDSFDVNVFAVINTVKAALPYMRDQRSGYIINISSIAGFAPGLGWSIYAAAKHAVIGLSEVLAEEVKPLGINVTVVAPGAFRTSFLSEESIVLSKDKIDDYKAVHELHKKYLDMNGAQIGDPEKAIDAFIELANDPNPPVRLFLGSDALARAEQKLHLLTEDLEHWKTLSLSTDFTRE